MLERFESACADRRRARSDDSITFCADVGGLESANPFSAVLPTGCARLTTRLMCCPH